MSNRTRAPTWNFQNKKTTIVQAKTKDYGWKLVQRFPYIFMCRRSSKERLKIAQKKVSNMRTLSNITRHQTGAFTILLQVTTDLYTSACRLYKSSIS